MATAADTIQILIAFLALLFAGFLLVGRSKLAANRFLAGFLVVLAVQLVALVTMQAGALPRLAMLTASLGMVFGPLVFMYVRALLGSGPRSAAEALHFLPAVGVFLSARFGSVAGVVHAVLSHVSLAGYLGASIVFLWRRRTAAPDDRSPTGRRASWALEILLVGVAALLADVVRFWAELGNLTPYREQTRLLLFVVLLVLVTRAVLKGLTQPDLFRSRPEEPAVEVEKYAGSSLSAAEAQEHARRFVALMESERLFVDAEVTLDRVARRLELSPRTLSQVINGQLGRGFSEVMNGYRIEEAKRLLADPDRSDENILEVSLDAGFNSKSAFNQAFKRFTGVTPSEFRRRLRP